MKSDIQYIQRVRAEILVVALWPCGLVPDFDKLIRNLENDNMEFWTTSFYFVIYFTELIAWMF